MAHGAEGRVAQLYSKLTAEKRQAYLAKIKKSPVKKLESFATAPTHALKLAPRLAVVSIHDHAHPLVRSVPDKQRKGRDKKNFEALREAYGGNIPGINHPQ